MSLRTSFRTAFHAMGVGRYRGRHRRGRGIGWSTFPKTGSVAAASLDGAAARC